MQENQPSGSPTEKGAFPVVEKPSPQILPNQFSAAGRKRRPLFLAFILGEETFAIDILSIREIIEFIEPTSVPMMPANLRGVINVRGSVVPVIDLARRFGWLSTPISRRSSIVIVEMTFSGERHIVGLLVDKVSAVTEITEMEPPPGFGTRISRDFIRGMARQNGHFVLVLDLERTLDLGEIASAATTMPPP